MPLGNVIDPNTGDPSEVDTWALVTGSTVVNTILSSTTAITGISGNYDYSVNLHIQGQEAGIGWTYTPGTDTFAAPSEPDTDWLLIVQEDFDSVAEGIQQILSDYEASGLNSEDLATAYAYSLADTEDTFTPSQRAVMDAIYAMIQNGG